MIVKTIKPTLEECYRIMECSQIGVFSDCAGVDFTYNDELDLEEYRRVSHPEWSYPIGGIIILTGRPDEQGYYTSIPPDRCDHYRKTLRFINAILRY